MIQMTSKYVVSIVAFTFNLKFLKYGKRFSHITYHQDITYAFENMNYMQTRVYLRTNVSFGFSVLIIFSKWCLFVAMNWRP